MDRLPEPLTSFRQFVEVDLRRGARLIIAVQDVLDPQFRIATPEGAFAIALTFPADTYGRKRVLRRVSNFMAWKQAASFTLVSELVEPDCVYALGVSFNETYGCISRIRREPLPWTKQNFGPVEWLDERRIDPALKALLPRGCEGTHPARYRRDRSLVGAGGRFPAVHIPSGEVRGMG